MKDNIRFKGLSLNRDEQSAEHGELSLCGGVELHDGALRASVIDGTKIAGNNPLSYEGTVLKLLYVHMTTGFTHYISGASGNLYASKEAPGGWSTSVIASSGFPISGIRSVTSVGNTLVVFNDSGLHYFLCKQETNNNVTTWSYKYLGQKPPFLDIQFNLDKLTKENGNPNGELYELELSEQIVEENEAEIREYNVAELKLNENITTSLTEQVMARINERLDKATDKGYFCAPFFVRYCYRLFDGTSLIMHSPPVLMMPALHRQIITSIDRFVNKGDGSDDDYYYNKKSYKFGVFMMYGILQARVLNNTDNVMVNSLKEWKDIVKSVDIFISPQFSRIDTSKKIEYTVDNHADTNFSLMNGTQQSVTSEYESYYTHQDYDPHWYNFVGFKLPEFDEGSFFNRIRNNSSFFLLSSYAIDNFTLTNSWSNVGFENFCLKHISTREQMTDDYKTHNILIPSGSEKGGLYVYNHRLNVYGISERLFEGFSPDVAFPYNTGGVSISGVSVFIRTSSGGLRLEKSGSYTVLSWLLDNGYFFYPDDRAYAVVFNYVASNYNRKMDSSLTLNGSLAFMNGSVSYGAIEPSIVGNIVPITNKVYTSRADNPFYFPNLPGESGINSVGFGEVIGMAALTRALTQGAADDKSLAVFCTDGIWVLKVSPQGTYSEIKNKSRDVCVNPKSICQLDQSIIFASGRSLSRFVEQDVIPVSEILDGPYIEWSTLLPAFYSAFDTTGGYPDESVKRLLDFGTPAVDVFRTGTVLYDYMGKRLIIFPQSSFTAAQNADYVALVYSIRDQAWSTMAIPQMSAAIPGYPSPYIQYADGSVVCLDQPYGYDTAVDHSGLVITRTLTYSDTMDVIRGFRQLSDCASQPVLFFFGSNNQRTWQQLGFSQRPYHNYMPGRPFRFFRIALYFSQLKCSEEYQQLELEIINKYAKL